MSIFETPIAPLKGPFEAQLRVCSHVDIWDDASPTTVDLGDVQFGQATFALEKQESRRLGPWIVLSGDCVHRPLRDIENISAIHRRLASLPPTPEAYAKFALKYGIFGGRVYYLAKEDRPGYWYSLVSFYDWLDFGLVIKALVAAIDMTGIARATGGKPDITKFARTVNDSMSLFPPGLPWMTPRYMKELAGQPGSWMRMEGEDGFKILDELISYWTNRFLERWTEPAIEHGDRWSMYFKSTFVTGAVTTAIVNELCGASGLPRKCAGCGEWFMAEHGKQRHCTDSCKTKAYRRRQAAKKEEAHG